uniref:Uncharacterized protein n=1 Tax=Oryza barthii TaxID=65489 RepID=A0A0D3HKJ8_9ORYZ
MSAPQRLLSLLSSQHRSGGWSSIARQTQPHECKLHVLKDEDKRETYDQRPGLLSISKVSPLATASHRLKPWKSRRRQGARWRLHTAVYA